MKPPTARKLVARFPGKCSCGHRVQPGEEISYLNGSIVGCPVCEQGDLSGLSDEALHDHWRSCWALANNAVNMRARDGSVGRLLGMVDLAAAEMASRRAKKVA